MTSPLEDGATCAAPPLVTTYFLPRACDRALAAAVFDAADVRPSRSTCEAAVAALADVFSPRVRLCVRVLAAAVFDALPVLDEFRTWEAALAAFGPVILLLICIFTLISLKGVAGEPATPFGQARTRKHHAS